MDRAEKVALRLIARAEQNSFGLKAKLRHRGFDAQVTEELVSRLVEQDLVNDERYAKLWIRSRLSGRKAQSPRKLQISLGNRGIDINLSEKALKKELDPESEYALLLRFLEKSGFCESKSGFSFRGRLKHEGFSPEVLDRYFEK